MSSRQLACLVLVALWTALLSGCAAATADKQAATPHSASANAAGSPGVTLSVPAANRRGAFTNRHTLRLPRGWKAQVWALVPDARLEQWTPEGALLVSEPTNGQVVELTARGNKGAPPSQRVIVSRLSEPQGMAFDRVGGREVLYVAETDEIHRYARLGD